MDTWLKLPLPMRVGILGTILALLIIVAFPARAIEPGWYSPLDAEGRGTGQGIFIRCNLQDECAALWAAYRTSELQGLSEAASELITVVETSTAVTEASDTAVMDALQALRETQVRQQVWMVSQETCPAANEVCEFTFTRTESTWFAQGFEFLPVEVTAEFEATADSILVDFDAVELRPEVCDAGPGGLLFNDCIGVAEFFLIAR